MPRRLLILTLALVIVGVVFAGGVFRLWLGRYFYPDQSEERDYVPYEIFRKCPVCGRQEVQTVREIHGYGK